MGLNGTQHGLGFRVFVVVVGDQGLRRQSISLTGRACSVAGQRQMPIRGVDHVLVAAMYYSAGVLGGSWHLLTNYNCTYNPLISAISALIYLR